MNFHPGQIRVQDDVLALGTEPIPAKYYFDPEWFELERKAVFMRSWVNVGHVCEVDQPGSFVRRDIEFAKASLLIVRGKDGEVRAFHNACTHRGTQLTKDACGKKANFNCPYHSWTFGTDGRLLSAPDFGRFYVEKEALGLKQVALEVCGGLIFICFEPQQSLREYLGPLTERLENLAVAKATTFHEYTYTIDANWKLTYDNFQENYHLRFVHSRTAGPGTGGDNPFGYPSSFTLDGIHRTQTLWTDPGAQYTATQKRSFGRGMPRLAADGLLELPDASQYFALFPNFFLLCNPGNHFLHTVMPISATQSRGVIRLYWVGEDETASVRYAREYAMATTRDIHAEDIEIIESGQRGIGGGALEYIHFQEQEILCRHFVKVVEEKVEAFKAEVAG